MPSFHQGLTQALAATSLWVFLLVVVQWAWSKRIGIDISLDAWLKDHVVDTIVVALLGNVVAWRDHEIAEKLKAQTQAIETRNRLLHSQLHPHVLFNALTGLSELTLHDPARAADGMKSLATLLRRLLDLGGQDLFRLQEEQEIVRCYLSIETLRLGDRLKVEWDWEESINHLEVIPLLLQPLVENAIKHGIAPCIQGGMLRISAHRIQGELVMEVANTGAPYTPTRNPRGIGLLNLESRLKSTYGDQARLQMYTQESWTIARISILAALLG
jgi:LytS/YehU family sensor histidine kinase